MADTFGILPLPAAAPSVDVAAGDPALTLIGAFLKGAINRMATMAWQAVCAGRLPVDHVFTNDPVTQFDEERLPALYLWRGALDTEQFTDDTVRHTSQVTVWWITEPGSNDALLAREPVINLVAKAMAGALARGRDPGWVVTADPDAQAATKGSLLKKWAGLTALTSGKVTPLGKAMVFTDSDGREVPVPGLASSLSVVEDLVRDASINRDPHAVRVDIDIPAATPPGPFDTGYFADPAETP